MASPSSRSERPVKCGNETPGGTDRGPKNTGDLLKDAANGRALPPGEKGRAVKSGNLDRGLARLRLCPLSLPSSCCVGS